MNEKQQPTYSAITGRKTHPLIPKQLQPTKRFASILGIIFLGVLALGAIQFPYGSMLSGNTDVTIDIGYPYPFLELSLANPEELPLNISGLLIDLSLYLILSYAIDIAITLMINATINKKQPTFKTFKTKPKSLAEKATQKALQIAQPLEVPEPEPTQPTPKTTQTQNQ